MATAEVQNSGGEEVPPYRYEPLAEKTIRLLEIPKSIEQPWALKTYELGNVPSYNCISYTWGPPHDTLKCEFEYRGVQRNILVANGEQIGRLAIGLNLWEGLQQSIESVAVACLWVDAICINQDDMSERTSQVAIMGQIFAQCEGLFIWLGKGHGSLDDFCWFHETLLDTIEKWQDDHGTISHVRRIAGGTTQEQKDDLIKRWHGYILFYEQCRWFHRCWVLQEVALAPQVKIFCGSKYIEWYDVEAMSGFLNDYSPCILPSSGWKPAGVKTELAAGHILHKIAQQRNRCLEADLNSSDDMFAITGPEDPLQLYLAFLLSTLASACGFRASIPQDKVYASLGMAAKYLPLENDPMIVPDYKSSVRKLYRRVAMLFILKLPYVGCLSYVQDQSQRERHDLPSWVPDFSSRFLNTAYILRYETFPHNACPVRDLRTYQRCVSGTVLQLYGVYFDTVLVVDEGIDKWLLGNEGFMGNHAVLILSFLDGLIEFLSALDCQYTNGQTRLEAFARTLILNQVDRGPPPDDPASCFCAWLTQAMTKCIIRLSGATTDHDTLEISSVFTKSLRALKESREVDYLSEENFRQILSVDYWAEITIEEREPEDLPPEVLQESLHQGGDHRGSHNFEIQHQMYQRALDSALFLRQRLYRTSGGYIGLGPPSMATGDHVIFLCDSKVPFILRPAWDIGYRLVGETYLHGFMNGEVVDADFDDRIKPIFLV